MSKQYQNKQKKESLLEKFRSEMSDALTSGSTLIHVTTSEEMRFLDDMLKLVRGVKNRPACALYVHDGTGTICDLAVMNSFEGGHSDFMDATKVSTRWITPTRSYLPPITAVRWFEKEYKDSDKDLKTDKDFEKSWHVSNRYLVGSEVDKVNPMNMTDPAAWILKLNSAPVGSILILFDVQVAKHLRPVMTNGSYASDTNLLRTITWAHSSLAHQKKTVIIVSHENMMPESAKNDIVFMTFPLPDHGAISNMIDVSAKIKMNSGGKNIPPIVLSPAEKDEVIRAVSGLSAAEINRVLRSSNMESAKSWVEVPEDERPVARKFDINIISDAKSKRLGRSNPAMKSIKPDFGLDEVGGMAKIKSELALDRIQMDPNVREIGLGYPKGFLMVGPGGTGKTRIANAISRDWKLPGFILNIGACRSKWVGESRNNLEDALKMAEEAAPCVTADTKILTMDGEVTIADLIQMQGGPRVKIPTVNDSGEIVESEIHAIVPKGKKTVFVICDENDNVIHATDNHKFLVRTEVGPQWKEVSELREGDDLIRWEEVDSIPPEMPE